MRENLTRGIGNAQRTFNVSFPGGGQETLFFNAAEMTVKGVEAEEQPAGQVAAR